MDFFEIGKNYFVQTVTYAFVGRLSGLNENELRLDDPSWIADTGRFSNAFKEGFEKQSSSEIEPLPDPVIIGRNAITHVIKYNHDLPSLQK